MPKLFNNRVYLAIELDDKYELPFAVACSSIEIANILNMSLATVRYGLMRQQGIFRNKGIKIEMVEI